MKQTQQANMYQPWKNNQQKHKNTTKNRKKYDTQLLSSHPNPNINEGDDRVTDDSHRRYFISRVEIENYNTEADGRNFYDHPSNDLINQYDEVRKVSTGQGEDYTTGFLLDFAYFEKNYRLIAANLSK